MTFPDSKNISLNIGAIQLIRGFWSLIDTRKYLIKLNWFKEQIKNQENGERENEVIISLPHVLGAVRPGYLLVLGAGNLEFG